HIGDLETPSAYDAFRSVIADLEQFYQTTAPIVAADAHPDYLSSRFAAASGRSVVAVQHHYAHVLSCVAEHQLNGAVLAGSWDGTGYGLDRTIWGGEFLVVDKQSFTRVAHFRSFPLPGGDSAVKEPRRSAVGVLYELKGKAVFHLCNCPALSAFSANEVKVL